MRKIFSAFIAISLLFCISICSFAEPQISAKSAVVISADSKEVIYAKNAYECLPMASTTKIMTSLVALELGVSDSFCTVTDEMVSVEGTSMGLKPGDSVSTLSLVKGMLLSSGNDAANATAYLLTGGIEPFVDLMNKKAKAIGMNNTNFVTPSGLDAQGHYSTAYDMALLGANAIVNPDFLSICSSKNQTVSFGNPAYKRVLTNHNRLLSAYEGAIGIKTGFTKKSGRCLVSAVEKDGKTLVAVTLSAPDDWNDHIKLYDYALPLVKSIKLGCDLSQCKLKIVGGNQSCVDVCLQDNIFYTVLKSNLNFYYKIYIKQFEYAPVSKGEVVGKVDFYCNDGSYINSVNLVTVAEVLTSQD